MREISQRLYNEVVAIGNEIADLRAVLPKARTLAEKLAIKRNIRALDDKRRDVLGIRS